MDNVKLLQSLDNPDNESIINLTTNKIWEMNLNILEELHLDKETIIIYLKKLNGYRYIDEIKELKYGAYIKWIPITDPTYLPLNNTSIICDIRISDDSILITCKNFMHKHFTFKMDEVLIFQKLSSQEQVIIYALDHLDK